MNGKRRWFSPGTVSSQRQRGFPMPLGAGEERNPPWEQYGAFGGVWFGIPRRNDLGAAGFTPNFGTVFVNPIGAGVVALHRPQASYGLAGQYIEHIIFWAQQTIPTSVKLGALTTPQEMQALLGTINVQAAVRTY